MPTFVDMQTEYGEQGLTIVAVAMDDVEAVSEFAQALGLNFPVLIGESAATEVSRAYGNRFGALPYSALVDRQGRIRYIKPGELTREAFERELRPLL
jgi:peroxiredoxin